MSALAKAKKGPPDLAIILGSHKPEMDDDEAEEAGGGHDGAKKDAMEAFIEAVHDKDAEAALEAFSALHDMHVAEDEDEGDEEEDEEKD